MPGGRHVQPAFVNPEGLHKFSVTRIDGVPPPRVCAVQFVMRGQKRKLRAFPPGAGNSLSSLDAVPFCRLVFGKDDAVPVLGVAAHGHGHIF